MFTADAHCDTLYRLAVCPNDLPLQVTRETLEKGCVGIQTFALFAGTHEDPGTPVTRAQNMLDAMPTLGVPMITGRLPDDPPAAPHGVLSIEGGEILDGSMEELERFARLGVRMIALTWNYENQIAYPVMSGSRKGLKPFGRELLDRMGELGVIADVSHLNDAGIEDVLSLSRLPVAASHSNLREITNVPRNLPRALAKGIIESGGFIGMNFAAEFLASGRAATLDDVRRHMDGVLDLGGVSALGFGSDFDGITAWPEGLDGASRFPALLAELALHGYGEKTLRAIAGENLWRLYKQAESVKK